MAKNASTAVDTYLAKHTELKATLETLVKQHKKNVSVKRTEVQELGINLKNSKELLKTVANTSSELDCLKALFKAISKPDKNVSSKHATLVEEFLNFREEMEKTRVGLESDFINKIQGCIVEIERKLGEYESYITIATRGQMLRNNTVLKERMSRFKEDIFDDLEPRIRELFLFIIEETSETSHDSLESPDEPLEPKHARQHSGTVVEELAPPTSRKKRTQTATVYTYKMKDNVTAMHYGQRIVEIYQSWKRLEAKTQVYYLALKFRLKEREVGKDLLDKAEKWYLDHKDTQDTRLLVKEYERYFINGHIFDTFETQFNGMQELCRQYAEYKEVYQIGIFQNDQMIELYHGYQKRYMELKHKIDELVPYLKANAYERVSSEIEDKLQKLETLLVGLLSTLHSMREQQQGINTSINERVVEILNELTAADLLIGQLNNEYECLSTSLAAKKKEHYETICSNLHHHQSDFNKCRDGLMALWVEDTETNFVQREKFESQRFELSNKLKRDSYQGKDMAFLIKQSDTKQSQDDIWAPSLNLTNMNSAAEILGEMFDVDDGDGLDAQQAEELIGYALDLLDGIRIWAEDKMLFLKSSKLEHVDVTTGTIEFFKLQSVRDEMAVKQEEFDGIKSEYQSVLLESHYIPISDILDTFATLLSSQEQVLSIQLVFIQDFASCLRESNLQLEQRWNSIDTIFRTDTDITAGLALFKDMSGGLTEVERGVSKLTRKAIVIKKRFPRIDLSSQTSDLSNRFLYLKREVNEQLNSAQLGAQQLSQYNDQLIANREKLNSFKERTQVALRMPPSISGSHVDGNNVKEIERELVAFKTEFESIPILQKPPPTKLSIPSDTTAARDSILSEVSGIHGDINTWNSHTTAVREALNSIQSKFNP